MFIGLLRGNSGKGNPNAVERPIDSTDEEMCNNAWDLIYSNRRIQVEVISQALVIHIVDF